MIGLLEIILFFLGGVSGFLAGLLGIGGAIVLIPMMIYILPYFGFNLSMHEIMGLSMALVFFAALTGAIIHFKGGNLRKNLIIVVGGAMLAGSLLGAIASRFVMEKTLLGVFALVLALSIAMLLKPKEEKHIKKAASNGDDSCSEENIEKVEAYMTTTKEKITGASLGFLTGVISGMAGVGGAAILIPALTFFLRIPIKICIGTSLGIILAGGAAGFFGKAITGQIPFMPALFLAAGGILSSRLGSKVSMKLKGEQLKKILAVVLLVTLIRIIATLVTF